MPTPRNGDSAQAAIALLDGALQASKPRPVKTEPPTEAVAGALPARAAEARAVRGRASAVPATAPICGPATPAAARDSAGESPVIRWPCRPMTIARRLPRVA